MRKYSAWKADAIKVCRPPYRGWWTRLWCRHEWNQFEVLHGEQRVWAGNYIIYCGKCGQHKYTGYLPECLK